ncbi:helix-turn-helix transcriptional regulator [Pseudoteredinibacter isoporae]|uniref:helix-turn-helix transcriptional regulator n=1 Tax=Pseudoteredinibacter isoporae TaxID=570281 RepID=UPI0031099318
MLEALIPAMARVTEHLGQDRFADSMMQLFERICPVQSLAAFAFLEQDRPQLLLDIYDQGVIAKQASMSRYMSGAYLLDPYFQACQEQRPAGLYRLQELAADDFEQSEYFRQYFQYANFADEIGYLQRIEQGYIHLSLCRTSPFDEDARATLNTLCPWVLAVMSQQWQEVGQVNRGDNADNMHQRLQQAFAQFGQSFLTQREAEIARLLLQGHSTKSMAERLGISMETVKVHKRNLYNKLDINSQSELFSLFLNSLSTLEPQDMGDPLQAYHQRPKP